ncbi:MAG TPA: winged helix-turn-helix domain-containing protein [Dehalococcoidia bacterium]|nr:winged helix-turn-helix domain-containing protein [Dehalococcoidia bacterium]
MSTSNQEPRPTWTLVTSHGLVLLYVALEPAATIREIAEELEVTERRVADIIRDLTKADLIIVKREGRRNYYTLGPEAHFRHRLMADVPLEPLIRLWKRMRSRRTSR